MTSNSGTVAEEKAFLMVANKYTGYARRGFSIAAPHYSLDSHDFLSKQAHENLSVLEYALLRNEISADGSLLWQAVQGLTKRSYFHDFIENTDRATGRTIGFERYYEYHQWYTGAAVDVIGCISKAVRSGKGSEAEMEFWSERLEPFVTKKPGLRQKLGLGTR